MRVSTLAQPPDPAKVSTKQVWPWSLLVPWMEADLRVRAARLAAQPASGARVATVDPYDNPLVMPLAEFLEAPIVADLLHNGAALQVQPLGMCAACTTVRWWVPRGFGLIQHPEKAMLCSGCQQGNAVALREGR